MNRSYFNLTLDTTGPVIEIYAPKSISPYRDSTIYIEADESLAPNHEVYVVDQLGKRVNLIGKVDKNIITIKYNFADIISGICTIYARVKDDVLNKSETASRTLRVFEEPLVEIESSINNRSFSTDIKQRTLTVFERRERQITSSRGERDVKIKTDSRSVIRDTSIRDVVLTVTTGGDLETWQQ